MRARQTHVPNRGRAGGRSGGSGLRGRLTDADRGGSSQLTLQHRWQLELSSPLLLLLILIVVFNFGINAPIVFFAL